jgi:inhibitor of cysteine peptidase
MNERIPPMKSVSRFSFGLGVLLVAATAAALPFAPAIAQTSSVPHVCLFPIPEDGQFHAFDVGQQFALVLNSNRTTGYEWSLSEDFFNQDIVELVGHQYISQPTGLLGSGGVECWIFEAQSAGGTEIQLVYTRPWESGGIPPARTATYYVSVNQ